MVTYSCRHAKLRVRILAPHPIMILLAVLLLIDSAHAAAVDEDDYYNYDPVVASDMSVARAISRVLTIMGSKFTYTEDPNKVLSIDGVEVPADSQPFVYRLGVALSNAEQRINSLDVGGSALLDYLKDSSFAFSRPYVPAGGGNTQSTTYSGYGLISLIQQGLTATLQADVDLYKLFADKHQELAGVLQPSGSFPFYAYDPASHALFYDESAFSYSGFASFFKGLGLSITYSLSSGFDALCKHLDSIFSGSWSFESYWLDGSGVIQYGTYSGSGILSLICSGFQKSSGAYALTAETLHRDMVGSDGVFGFLFYDIADDGSITTRSVTVSNLLDALGQIGMAVQGPLARLQYVLASDDDIAFKAAEKENMDTAKDSFFGDGAGAVKSSNITDVAGVTGGITNSFSGAGSPSDVFIVINDDSSWGWFSSSVRDSLQGNGVQALDDDFLDQFVADEDGFYSLADRSAWDVDAYLGGFLP